MDPTPAPIDRDDDAILAPLDVLRLPGGTEPYLGVVHHLGLVHREAFAAW